MRFLWLDREDLALGLTSSGLIRKAWQEGRSPFAFTFWEEACRSASQSDRERCQQTHASKRAANRLNCHLF